MNSALWVSLCCGQNFCKYCRFLSWTAYFVGACRLNARPVALSHKEDNEPFSTCFLWELWLIKQVPVILFPYRHCTNQLFCSPCHLPHNRLSNKAKTLTDYLFSSASQSHTQIQIRMIKDKFSNNSNHWKSLETRRDRWGGHVNHKSLFWLH